MISHPHWHNLSADEDLGCLSSSASGPSAAEVTVRLDVYGPNQLTGGAPVSALTLLLDEFRSPLMLALVAADAASVVASQITDEAEQLIDTFLIWLILLLNAGLGFSQS